MDFLVSDEGTGTYPYGSRGCGWGPPKPIPSGLNTEVGRQSCDVLRTNSGEQLRDLRPLKDRQKYGPQRKSLKFNHITAKGWGACKREWKPTHAPQAADGGKLLGTQNTVQVQELKYVPT